MSTDQNKLLVQQMVRPDQTGAKLPRVNRVYAPRSMSITVLPFRTCLPVEMG